MAVALGYDDATKAVRDHVEKEDKIMEGQNSSPSITDSLGRTQYPVWINESGLYSLILGSKLEKAKEFKHWVTAEVLPTIRKTGGYINPGHEDPFVETYLPLLLLASFIPEHRSSCSLLHPLHLVFSPRIVSMLSYTNFSVRQSKTDLRTKYAIKNLFINPLMPQ